MELSPLEVADHNPEDNKLGPGVSDDMVTEAIHASGFPLQTIISAHLSHEFLVQEEWAYYDRNTGKTRALDVLGLKLIELLPSEESRLRPTLALLIECKQSDLPYVFFASETSTSSMLPRIAGIARDEVVITTDDDRSTWTYPILHALGLEHDEFAMSPPHSASTFSKCVWTRGSGLTLSGSEPYQDLVLPLMSAVEHFIQEAQPPRTAFWFDAYLVVPIIVLDAPMIVVHVDEEGNNATLAPWIRVHRHEPRAEGAKRTYGDLFAIDVVHRSLFNSYVADHLMPFATKFNELAHIHDEELASGKAFAPGMGDDPFSDLEKRLQAKTVSVGPPQRFPHRRFDRLRIVVMRLRLLILSPWRRFLRRILDDD